MTKYNVRLLETRMSDFGGDDAAIFSVTCEENGRAWQVAALLSPLFRHLHMERAPSIETRRDMVAGMGVRAISEQLEQGLSLEDVTYLVLGERYVGAPGAPEPIGEDEQVAIVSGDGRRKRVRKEQLAVIHTQPRS